MNSTDAALSWLLSLSATCSSSPFRPSSPADYLSDYTDDTILTDWLKISPSPSPTTTKPSSTLESSSSSSSPVRDVLSLSPSKFSHANPYQKIQQIQETDFFLNEFCLDANFTAGAYQNASVGGSGSVLTSEIFSNHHYYPSRVFSLDSSCSTLVDSPPRPPPSLAAFNFLVREEDDNDDLNNRDLVLQSSLQLRSPSTIAFNSPIESKPLANNNVNNFIGGFSANSPFGNFYDTLPATSFAALSSSSLSSLSSVALPALSFSDVSPIVRASQRDGNQGKDDDGDDADTLPSFEKENQPPFAKNRKKRKFRAKRNIASSRSFIEHLQTISTPTTVRQRPAFPLPAVASQSSDIAAAAAASSAGHLTLLSPAKIPSHSFAPSRVESDSETLSPKKPQQDLGVIPAPPGLATPPSHNVSTVTGRFFSPLSPLTPLPSPGDKYPDSPSHPLKIKIVLKRKNSDLENTSIRNSKRPRRRAARKVALLDSPSPEQEWSGENRATESEGGDDVPEEEALPRFVYTNRSLPANIEISADFPLLYRRFPVSSYYQPADEDSPCTLFGVQHPGGNYNPPRSAFDLYTPRFVRGKGVDKVGLCPICVEPFGRGGEDRKIWLAMKFSAFNYHMQYAHGVAASTGKPFSPPVAFRIVSRQNVGKNEKSRIREGQCHKCNSWIVAEGIKDVESKVPELYWWKHAATCHHDSTLEGEGDYFEEDEVYATYFFRLT